MVEARSTSITTATPPWRLPGGIRLGSRCTEIMARSARMIGIGGAIPTSSRRFSFFDRSEKGLLDYGIAWSIWGDPADQQTGRLPCLGRRGGWRVAGGEWRVASRDWLPLPWDQTAPRTSRGG